GLSLPSTSGEIEIVQSFPATMQALAVVAQKVGDATLSSPQIANQREMPADNQTFIAATGGAINAGQPIVLTLSGLPHHSAVPQRIALILAAGIAIVGFVAVGKRREPSAGRAAERKRLIARREKLLAELARLESDKRAGRTDDARYA